MDREHDGPRAGSVDTEPVAPRWQRSTIEASHEVPAPAMAAAAATAIGAGSGPGAFDPRDERYVTGGELGRGGMGRVVAATDTTLDRQVAIKQVLGRREEDVARFEREVRITARLEHPSIVPIHDAGRDRDGRPYYVMRRIEGEPLSERVAAAAGIRERLARLPSVLAAVDAAAFAHARRVVHRDIKPCSQLLSAGSDGALRVHEVATGRTRVLVEPGRSSPARCGQIAARRSSSIAATPGSTWSTSPRAPTCIGCCAATACASRA